MVAVYASVIATRFRSGGLAVQAYDAAAKQEIVLQGNQRMFVLVPDLGWLFAMVLLSAVVPVVLYFVARSKNDARIYAYANNAMFLTILLQVIVMAAFVIRIKNGTYPAILPQDSEFAGNYPSALPANPFLMAGAIGSVFAGLLYMLLLWRRTGLQALLPSTTVLDRVTYKTIGIAFPLLTLMIATGAYWANQAWGSYWSWDPKETWAAITWLVYAGYLHMRITLGWKGRRAAWFAILGFGVVVFTFFGVTYLLPGLHAYGAN
jgi:cytochrome c-type biogenesis protein CcsB